MDETTTPDADATQAQVVEDTTAQPDGAQYDEAVTDQIEPTSTDPTDEGPALADNPTEDDLSDYWTKKGIDITTEEGQRKAAQSYREAEKAMTQKAQKASELSKQLLSQPIDVDSDNPLVQQLASKVVQMERQQSVSNFVNEVQLTAEQEQTMASYLTQNPQKAQMINAGLMTLNEVYTLSGAATPDAAALRQAGGQEALQNLANKQRASAVSGNAVNSNPPTGLTAATADSWWDSLGPEGRADPANRAKLDSILR